MTVDQRIQQAIRVTIVAIMDAVDEAGDDGVPSGSAYAILNSFGMNLDTYNAILSEMEKIKLITVKDNVIMAVRE